MPVAYLGRQRNRMSSLRSAGGENMAAVLIVEDDRIVARDLSEMLVELGHNVAGVASDYQTAVAFLQAGGVELALIDIQLDGDRDGIALGVELREEHDVAFAFLTSNCDRATIAAAAAVRPNGYLVKPCDEASLHALLETSLANYVPRQPVDYNRLSELRTRPHGGLSFTHRNIVERVVARRLATPLTVKEIAAHCSMSPSAFQRAFRQTFGCSVHHYITEQRVQEAKRLLRNTDWSISEIAAASGFSGQAHLTTVFRVQTGATPARYRKSL